MNRLASLLIVALAGAAPAGAVLADGAPPEPAGFRTGVLKAPVPETLSGARVVDLAGLEAMVAAGAVLVDVGPAPVRPPEMPADALWLPTHRSLPGAAWMPGAGLGDDLVPEREALFLAQVAELTGGNRSRPVVVFCKPDCWASWNAGKRLVRAGYVAVTWFPGGVEAWQEAHPTRPVEAMTGWGEAGAGG